MDYDDLTPQPLFSHSYLLYGHLKIADKHGAEVMPKLPLVEDVGTCKSHKPVFTKHLQQFQCRIQPR